MKIFSLHISTMMLVTLVGCHSSASLKDGQTLSKASGTDEESTQDLGSAEEESAVPPNNISGAYLSCSYETTPSVENPEAFVGCRMEDDEGQRVPASTLGLAFQFSYSLPAASPLTIYARDLADDGRYDAAYLVFASDPVTLLSSMAETSIFVTIEGEKTSGQNVVLSERFADIERDAATIQEAPTLDYEVVREEILVDAQNGAVTPPF